MVQARPCVVWFGIRLALALLLIAGIALGLTGLRVSRAEVGAVSKGELAPQVTVFVIQATPASKTIDANLASVKPQLERLMPQHGFKLLDARSKRIGAGESLVCQLNNGYTIETFLVQPADENGKVQFRCEVFQNKTRQFSTLVKAPLNQLFFYERSLPDKSRLLIGVGAR